MGKSLFGRVREATEKSPLGRIAQNVGAITASNFVGRAFLLLLNAAIARAFGAEGLGGYASATAVASYFLLGADLGLSPRLVREGAVRPAELDQEYARSASLKVPITLASLGILAILYLTLPYEPEVLLLCMLMSLNSLAQSWSYLNHAVCRARERLGLEAISHTLHGLFFAGGAALLVSMGAPLLTVGAMALTSALCQVMWSRGFARTLARLRIGWPPRVSALRDAAPYATASLAGVAFQQIDILLMSVMVPLTVVGEYAAITRLLRLTGFLSTMAGNAVLPTASRVFARSTDRFRDVAPQALALSLVCGGAVATGLFAGASLFLRWIYGEEFGRLAPLFQIGTIYAWITFGSAAVAMLLTACGRQGQRARSLTLAGVVRAALVALAVPIWGVLAALVALLVGEIVLLVAYLVGLRGVARVGPIVRTLLATLVSFGIAVAAGVGAEAAGWPLAGVMLMPMIVYPIGLLVTGEASRAWTFLRTETRAGG